MAASKACAPAWVAPCGTRTKVSWSESPRPTTTASSSWNSALSKARARGVSSSRWITRFTGLPPKMGSKPRTARELMAEGVIARRIRFSASLETTPRSLRFTMWAIWFALRGSKMMNSSTRFTNSGLKCLRTCSMTTSFMRSLSTTSRLSGPASWCCCCCCCLRRATAALCSRYISALPKFEVMMMMAFLKLTSRPWPSVTRPSSRI
mmetsp:Transcript_28046/g.75763  ORF Transcript_28046/g.75763 Transcript_28046/m.75763 type:complete len:207 (-) Transcript_28046:2229-2849(-)